ncbi:MAG TPA: DEAD/DEAH box helicase [Rhodocyclaceae bacterium]|nr:DEAD/DEAH box helicase [Rhodocyclaceae bacterium]
MDFSSLGLSEPIAQAVLEAGYTEPTSVQLAAIPAALAGKDLVVSSRTGSGKTAAFMLPSLQRLTAEPTIKARGPRVLVLTPTRELAVQVTDATKRYGKNLRYAKAVSVVGGMPYPVQNKLLSAPYEILVATPGRLMDQMNRGRIDFGRLEILILDEADRMLDMGFVDDIEAICAALPKERQTLFFSATLDGQVARMMQRLLKDPERIEIATAQTRHDNIEQRLLVADDIGHKHRLLDGILRDVAVDQAIVFTATKRDADALTLSLEAQGHSVAALHGDMNQRMRTRTLDQLRRGHLRVLIATDVAARGIDVRRISHVINYDLPKVAADYVHRIGRTGRGGDTGVAISLAERRDVRLVRAIERYTRQTMAVHTLPGLEPRASLPTEERRPAGPRRDGRSFGNGPRFGDRRPREGGFGAPRFEGDRPARDSREGGHAHRAAGDARHDGPRRSFGQPAPRSDARGGFSGARFGERPAGRADSRPRREGRTFDRDR